MTNLADKSLTVVAVGGFSSDTGKTTLVCELLRVFPGWEAIKITRGHYRSCGKDPHACCVSDLLGDAPLIRSGRAETYAPGKDTGRFWEAGARNVHWVIATDRQVEEGIRRALARVEAEGVFVEGTSFVQHVGADFVVLAARAEGGRVKPSARRALSKASALYLFEPEAARGIETTARERFDAWREEFGRDDLVRSLPVYTREDLGALVARVREAHAARMLSSSLPRVAGAVV